MEKPIKKIKSGILKRLNKAIKFNNSRQNDSMLGHIYRIQLRTIWEIKKELMEFLDEF